MIPETDEKFLERVARDYPNEDWDAFPDEVPNIFKVQGWQTEQHPRLGPRQSHFEVDKEYSTREEAEVQARLMKTETCWEDVISTEIVELAPSEWLYKHLDKERLKRMGKIK